MRLQGAGDVAVAASIGASIFDVLAALGWPWLFGALALGGVVPGVREACARAAFRPGRHTALQVPCTMFVPAVALCTLQISLMFLVAWLEYRVLRWLGALMLVAYCGWVALVGLGLCNWP